MNFFCLSEGEQKWAHSCTILVHGRDGLQVRMSTGVRVEQAQGFGKPDTASNTVDSDVAGNVMESHEHGDEYKEP